MKKVLAIALAVALAFSGAIASSHSVDAREGGARGLSGGGGGARFGGGGLGRMDGGGGFSSRFNGATGGARLSSPRMSDRQFSGPRVSNFGNVNRGSRNDGMNRRGKWAGNNGWNGGNKWRGNRRGYRNYAFYGAPFIASSAYGYYDGDCGWLRRRAIETGSGYWWSRYDDCRYNY